MAKGIKTGGRQKGTPNHLTSNARAAFRAAFDGMGGINKLTEWAKENPTEFYRIYARLIPVDVNVEQKMPIRQWLPEDQEILDRAIERKARQLIASEKHKDHSGG